MRGEVKRKGFWHEPDAAPTSKTIAMQAWVSAAHDLLTARAGQPMTQTELADLVQARTLIHTSHPVANWVPEALALVDKICERDGERPLSRLVSLRPPSRAATRSTRGSAERAGAPRRTATSPRPAPAPRKVAKSDRPVTLCPTCFMALPSTGVCDTCG